MTDDTSKTGQQDRGRIEGHEHFDAPAGAASLRRAAAVAAMILMAACSTTRTGANPAGQPAPPAPSGNQASG